MVNLENSEETLRDVTKVDEEEHVAVHSVSHDSKGHRPPCCIYRVGSIHNVRLFDIIRQRFD